MKRFPAILNEDGEMPSVYGIPLFLATFVFTSIGAVWSGVMVATWILGA